MLRCWSWFRRWYACTCAKRKGWSRRSLQRPWNSRACRILLQASCGYRKEHTVNEYTVIADLQNCLNFIEEILLTLTEERVYEIEIKYNYYGYGYYGGNSVSSGYDFDWIPDAYDDSWDKYDEACVKADGLFPRDVEEPYPKSIDYESIPCDTCADMDCKNCKHFNVI